MLSEDLEDLMLSSAFENFVKTIETVENTETKNYLELENQK